MGAGNPLIRSFDDDRYHPTTYFIDFTDFCPDRDEAVKEELISNDREEDWEEMNEDEKDKCYYQICEWNAESFREDYFFNLDEQEMIADWKKPDRQDRWLGECSASFRGSAVIIAENDDAYILTTDEAEVYHYPIAIIPKFKFDSIEDDIWDRECDKEDWYQARGLHLPDRTALLAEREYDKRLKKWRKKYEPFMRLFYSHFKEGLSMRNGAWMSTPLQVVGKKFKFV